MSSGKDYTYLSNLWDTYFYGVSPGECVTSDMLDKVARYVDAPDDSAESEIEEELEKCAYQMLQSYEEVELLVLSDVPDYVPGRLARYMFRSLAASVDIN